MSLFLINLFLALGFAFIVGEFSLGLLMAGFVVGYAALWVTRPLYGRSGEGYFARVVNIIKLALFFVWELIRSNIRVVWDVVTPSHISSPGIIGVPLDAKTDFEIMIVANLISLTPGTLSLDLSEDRRILYVHVMFLNDPARARREIKEGFEKRALEAIR
jgi:multicomponent Na+:H+ antiporter subunit E